MGPRQQGLSRTSKGDECHASSSPSPPPTTTISAISALGVVQCRRHRPHLADAGASRDVRALHLQPRMGRQRAVVREILRPGDARRTPTSSALPVVCSRLVPVLVLLREQEQQDQNGGRPQGQDDRLARMGAYRRGLHARLAQRRARRRAATTSTGIRPAPTRPGRIEKVELSLPKGVKLTRVDDKSLSDMLGDRRDRLRADRASARLLPAGPSGRRAPVPGLSGDGGELLTRGPRSGRSCTSSRCRSRSSTSIPGSPRNLYNAFVESKRRSVERLLDPAVSRYPLAVAADLRAARCATCSTAIRSRSGSRRTGRPSSSSCATPTSRASRTGDAEGKFPEGIMTSVRV